MNVVNEENVLCFPATLLTKLGNFEGFNPNASKYVHDILTSPELKFIERSSAEGDPTWKQLIPYQIIRTIPSVHFEDRFFTYRRGAAGGEDRLKKKRSLGVGGHINDGDVVKKENHVVTFHSGRLRELEEELKLNQQANHYTLGVIYNPLDLVGEVHFGVAYTIEIIEPYKVEVLDPAMIEHRWSSLEDLKNERSEFESWSMLVIDYLTTSSNLRRSR